MLIGITGAVASLGSILPTLQLSSTTLFVSSLAIVAAGFCAYILDRIRSPRRVAVRIALTGRPGAGKTVLANLLFDRLMNGNQVDVRISPDSATAISVYQAIRQLSANKWPTRTSSVNVFKYMAGVEYRSRIAPLRVDLELGDTGGESWLDLTNETDFDPQTREGFLEYVISSDALIHVIGCDEFAGRSRPEMREFWRSETDDLLFASRLVRATGRSKLPEILVNLSKFDLWEACYSGSSPLDEYLTSIALRGAITPPEDLRVHLGGPVNSTLPDSGVVTATVEVVQVATDLLSFLNSLAGAFHEVRFTFSSALLEEIPLSDLVWMGARDEAWMARLTSDPAFSGQLLSWIQSVAGDRVPRETAWDVLFARVKPSRL